MKTVRLGHPFSLLMSLLAIAATSPAKSQPITPANDGTGTTVTPQGDQFNIEGGTQSGANLFHSFDQFNVNSGQTANFLTTPDTQNILGRVTGGASYINGLIQVLGSNSNLFLMNPAGIMFGPNASLNIPASFSVTTATGIGFDNNNYWFKAMGTNDYSNLVGNPSGYRFNVSTPGAIVNEGNLHSGENLTLLGGTVINTGELSTTNGNITIAAVEGGSVLRISQPGHLLSLEVGTLHATSLQNGEDISNLSPLSLPELLTGGEEKNATSIIVNSNGELELTDNTRIADTPGNVFVSGNIDLSNQESESNFIVLANNDITVNNLIETAEFVELKAGRSIKINADIDTSIGNGNIDLLGNNDEMNIANRSDGKASINQLEGTTLNAGSGRINIELGNLGEVGDINLASLTTTGEVFVNANGGNIARVSENSLINADSVLFQTSGSGGIGLTEAPLQLNVENLEAVSGSGGIFFDVGNVNIGDVSEDVNGIVTIGGGDITLESQGDVTVTENIRADVITDNETAGDININAKNLSVIDGGFISLTTFTEADAGSVEINATETVVFDGGDSISLTGVNSSVALGAEGNAGSITITTRSLEVKNDARISTSTSGKGNAGSVEINATDSVVFDGGDSASLTVVSRNGVSSSVGIGAEGNAGNINITTGSLELKNGARISSSTLGEEGNAGNINITTGSLELKNGASIFADTFTKGNGGNIEINATDSVVFDGGDSISLNGVGSANSGAEGNAGSITITAGSLEVKNGAQIDSSTSGKGDAGSVEITATDTVVFDGGDSGSLTGVNSSIQPGAEGNAADVAITTGSLELTNGAQISTSTFAKGDAGSVEITATDTVVFDGRSSEILTGISSTVGPGAEGDAGGVSITTGSLEVINGGQIFASTFAKGNAGSVDIHATDTVVFDGGSSGILTGISSTARQGAEGNGGDVSITTGSLELTNGAQIFTSTFTQKDAGGVSITTDSLKVTNGALISASTFGNGDAGNIFIRTDTQLTINENGQISALTESTGDGGSIIITAPEHLNITGNGEITARSSGAGNAKQIEIISPNITISDGIDITAFTEGPGKAGTINLEGNKINIQPNTKILAFTETEGDGGNITIKATETLNLQADTQLSVETNRSGEAGNIEITTPQLTIGKNAQISATVNIGATTTDPGGNITINTNQLNIAGELGIFAETEASAKAGNLTLSPYKNNPNLDIKFSNDGFISASTSSTGNGGNIFITAPENIDISGRGFIAVETSGTGDAGIIAIQTDNLTISDRVSINASTTGAGDAGKIKIDTTDFTLEKGTSLTTETNSAGKAGDITINSPTVTIGENASISATALEGATNTETGENISIFSNTLNISGELGIFAQTEGESPAGTLTLKPYSDNPDLDINFSNRGFMSASTSSTGNGGNINIFAPETIDISGDGKITVETTGSGSAGDIQINTGSLTVTNGAEISANTGSNSIDASSNGNGVGGNIIIEATEIVNLDNNGRLSVETRGDGKAGNIEINSPEVNVATNSLISADARAEATNREAGGNIMIDTNTLNISGSEIFAQTQGETPAGTITLKPYNNNSGLNINFSNEGTISASTQSTGEGGNIFISAPETINIIGDGQIIAGSDGAGKAGNIEINSQQLTIAEDAKIRVSTIENSSNTEGGTISIFANTINLFSSELSESQSAIFAETESETSGGTITFQPYEDNSDIEINFSNQSTISARTLSTATGNAGNINISAPEKVKISGDGKISAENSGAGRGGNITIKATESIELKNLEISAESTSTSTGNAGEIRIETQELTIAEGTSVNASTKGAGNAGAIDIETQIFTLETGTSLTTETESAGQAGDITINSEKLTIGTDAEISATAKEEATNTEAGGNITINANDVLISGILGIFAETAGDSPAGTLQFNPYRNNPNLNINFTEEGFISARTTSTGNGGNINIFAPENINISGEGRITVETTGAGNAGIINIEAENLTIAENTTISAATSDTGDGGSININSNQTFQLEGQIITETTGTGNGGIITINTGEMTAPNSTISAKSTSAGNAGEINISAENNITTGVITSEANNTTETADGGNISIISEQGEINATQPIQSFSNQGNAGDVTLTAQNDITTNTISSHGQQQGGQISITTETGNIDTSNGEFLANYSGGGEAGNVTLTAPQGNITTTDIYSFADGNGGQITIKAGNNINITEDSKIISASEPPEQEGERGSEGVGRGGDIILEAGNNINTTTAQIYSGADIGDTGKIDIIGEGAIETGQINLASGFVREERPVNNNFTLIPLPEGEATQGVAGDITLRSNNSTIDTTAGTINSRSPDGTGNIILNARDNITTGKLEASALSDSQPTTGGDVEIISQQGQINATQAIETFSAQGTAGNVNIIAEGSVNIENILSQGTQRGGDITIDSGSENSINAQGELNTFSTAGTAGDVTLTSPGSISINGIRSDGMEQGGTITVESEIGEINSTSDIDSFSEQGIGGDVRLNASESVNLANVSSFGATESGDLIIESSTATVNTGNVTTQADGPSGNVIINGTQITTGNLSSLGTTGAGIIQLEATDGSITTLDLNSIAPEGEAGGIDIDAAGDVTTEDQAVISGDGDAQIDTNIGGNLDADTQTVEATNGDAEINNQVDGNINIDSQIAVANDGDATINNGAEVINIDSQTAISNGGDATINNTAEVINIPDQIAIAPDGTETITNTESNDTTTPIISTNNSIVDTTQTNTNTNIISTITPSNNNQTTNTGTAQEQTEESINNTTDTQEILNIIDTVNTNPLTVATGSDQVVTMLEENRIKEYSDYFGEDFNEKLVNTQNVRDILTDMAAQTGKESAVVYINAYDDQIQIILFTKNGQPILKTIPTVNRQKLWRNVVIFSAEIIDFRKRNTTSYLPLSQKLYNWLIAPISDELEAANIDTILFSMDRGFRLLPLAALHDGEQFLIEKYSMSLIPSVSLMDSRYNSVKNTKLLGMGASQFTDQSPLPAVPIELQTISEKLWRGNIFLNEEFTKNNLINELSNGLYPIVHLATHAEFRAGDANDSYVQLWDDKLRLDEVRKLRWNSEKAELLVLSACRTAVGDRNAELGFAGLAIAAGVKSALGSFWLVSDEGTLGLMTEFYSHLSNVKIKAEALREAQLAMLRGEVIVTDGTLRGSGSRGEVSLPSELENIQNKNFAHPYYWAGFTMVGSPW